MLSNRIKELRKQLGMTQKELAHKLSVSQQAVGGWETGRTEPNTETISKLAALFNVTSDYLIGKDGTPKWATKEDTTDLKEFLDSNAGSMTFGGVDLTPEQDAQVRVAMATIFWNEKKKEKK